MYIAHIRVQHLCAQLTAVLRRLEMTAARELPRGISSLPRRQVCVVMVVAVCMLSEFGEKDPRSLVNKKSIQT